MVMNDPYTDEKDDNDSGNEDGKVTVDGGVINDGCWY